LLLVYNNLNGIKMKYCFKRLCYTLITFMCFNSQSYKICCFAYECLTADFACDDAFQINSTCYEVHRDQVRWFTAVNRCLSNNATLATFDDDFLRYIPASPLQSGNAWIGLIKSWWTWPGLGRTKFDYINIKCLV